MINRGYAKPLELFPNATILSEITVANATEIVTLAAHGFVDGEQVKLTVDGVAGVLPNGLSASTLYYVKVIDANTFYLYTDRALTTRATFDDDGTASFFIYKVCRVMNVKDWRTIVAQINTSDSAVLTIKCKGSTKEDMPNFNAASSASNPWTYVQMTDLQDGDFIDGNTGLPITAAADANVQLEVNTNALNWITFEIVTPLAGKLQILATGFDNN